MKEGDFMNINKFTQKSIETIQLCEKLANDYGNSEIDQEHLALALVCHSWPHGPIHQYSLFEP